MSIFRLLPLPMLVSPLLLVLSKRLSLPEFFRCCRGLLRLAALPAAARNVLILGCALSAGAAFGAAPSFSLTPVDTSGAVGTTVRFGVFSQGTYPVSEQWQMLAPGASTWMNLAASGTDYSGGQTSMLDLYNVSMAMNGTMFRCVATNAEGSITSPVATLTVFVPQPVSNVWISRSPAGVVPYYDYFQLSANFTANGATGALTYQWYRDGAPVATGPGYYRAHATAVDTGSYTVTVTNAGGSAVSPAEVVTVATPVLPSVTKQPAGLTIEAGLEFVLSATATGSSPLSMQWYLNGELIPDATQQLYVVSSASNDDDGVYTVRFTNSVGSVTSEPVTVNVVSAALPRFTTGDHGYPATFGPDYPNITLNLYATGGKPLSYQWFKNGVAIPGATAATFQKYQATAADAGTYALQVSNETGVILSRSIRVVWLTSAGATPWLASHRLGDVVYFLLKTPGRILRYDLVQQAWLPVVALTPGLEPTGFLPTPEGVFVAYGSSVVRRSPDLQTEIPVTTTTASVSNFFARGSLVYFVTAYQKYGSFDRATLAAGPAADIPGALIWGGGLSVQPVISEATGKGYTTEPFSYPGDVVVFDFDGTGTITTVVESPYHGEFPVGTKRYVSPDGSRLYDNGGTVYDAMSLGFVGALGAPFDDLAFLGDGSMVVLRANQLVRHDGTIFGELGRRDLALPGKVLAAKGSSLYVFGAPLPGAAEPAVTVVPAAELPPVPAAAAPLNPATTRLSVDEAFIDDAGVVHVASRVLRGIARWDTTSRQFLSSLPFQGDPLTLNYAPAAQRLALAYGDGRITQFDLGGDGQETSLGAYLGRPLKLKITAADDLTIFSATREGSTIASRLEFMPDGTAKYTTASDNVYGASQAWDAATSRLYSFDNKGSISTSVGYATVAPGSNLPAAFEFSTAGPIDLVPLRFSATSSEVLLATGGIVSKELAPLGNLGTPVTDGVWLAAGLYTIRPEVSGTRIERWARAGYGQLGALSVAGKPMRILRVNDNQLVVVSLVNGYLAFHLVPTSLASPETFLSNSNAGGSPVIAQHPAAAGVAVGATAGFTVTAAGTLPLTYRWQVSATGTGGWSDIGLEATYAGASTAHLTVLAADALNGLFYRCAVTNGYGVTYSGAAQLTVAATALTVLSSPTSVVAPAGSAVAFAVQVSGSGPVSYRWQSASTEAGSWTDLSDDAIYGGTQTALLSVSASVPLSGTWYRCRAGNGLGSVTSAAAMLTVGAAVLPPTIALPPVSATVAAGNSATFIVAAAGVSPFTYRWQGKAANAADWSNLDDGGAYAGVTTVTLTVAGSPAVSGNLYRCAVSNAGGTTASSAALLTLAAPPVVTLAAPRRTVVIPNRTLNLGVTATGAGPLTYQWYRNGLPIATATSAALSLSGIRYADAGYYYADVVGQFGVTRSAAMFVIVAPPATKVVGWGGWNGGVSDYSALNNVVQLVSGPGYEMGVSRDGRIIGRNIPGTGINAVPSGLTDVVDLSLESGYALALKSDGTVVSWGDNPNMLPAVPAGLTDVVAISAGWYQAVALKRDGTVVTWGWPSGTGLKPVPADLEPAIDIVALSGGGMILKADGTVRGWGSSADVGMSNVAFIRNSGGQLALTRDGGLSAPNQGYGTPLGLTNLRQVWGNESYYYSRGMAVRNDGTVLAWGNDTYGETKPPAGLADVISVAGGHMFSVALVIVPTNDLGFVDSNPPTEVTAGSPVTLTLTVNNNGTKHWGASHRLVLKNAAGATVTSVSLSGTGRDQNKTVTLQFVAPAVGQYAYTIQALEEGTGWFGAELSYHLEVRKPVTLDYNGDGQADLLWRNTGSGQYAVWQMRGTAIGGSALFGPGPGWDVIDTGDYDGDGKSDLLWRESSSGALVLWLMNGMNVAGSTWIYEGGPAWKPVQFGDFNGDGKTDLLWHNTNDGLYAFWLMHGPVVIGTTTLVLPGNWTARAAKDFDGDGKADLLWRNGDNGAVVMWLINGTNVAGSSWIYLGGAEWQPVEFADFNADRKTDIVWRNTVDGVHSIWAMDGVNVLGSAAYGAAGWTVQSAQDFNGDGNADLLWRNTTEGGLVLWLMNGTAIADSGWLYLGGSWVPQHYGDYNGDGNADILWHNTNDDLFAMWLMNGLTVVGSSAFAVPGGWVPNE